MLRFEKTLVNAKELLSQLTHGPPYTQCLPITTEEQKRGKNRMKQNKDNGQGKSLKTPDN